MVRHGEFKSVGGKLVVADVELTADESHGKIKTVAITGDFFLEPAEALVDIAASLVGAPATAGEDELTRLITNALAPGVEMIGFSPEAVATAVRRAIDDPTPRERQ